MADPELGTVRSKGWARERSFFPRPSISIRLADPRSPDYNCTNPSSRQEALDLQLRYWKRFR
jgi:hypothetical protein